MTETAKKPATKPRVTVKESLTVQPIVSHEVVPDPPIESLVSDFLHNTTPVAPLPKTFEEQVRLLLMPTPKEFIKKRKGRGGQMFDYVDYQYFINFMNMVFGFDWSSEIKRTEKIGDSFIVDMSVTATFLNGKTVTKQHGGGHAIDIIKETGKPVSIENNYKAAISDAFKKACSMFGIARDVYKKVEVKEEERSQSFTVKMSKWQGEEIKKLRDSSLMTPEGVKKIDEWLKSDPTKGDADVKIQQTRNFLLARKRAKDEADKQDAKEAAALG